MARTFGGLVFFGPTDIGIGPAFAQVGTGAGQLSLTRNALGDWSLNNGAGATTFNVIADLSIIKRPYFTFPAFPGQGTVLTSSEFQELFGTAAGGPGNPFSGGATGSQFETPATPWGISIVDVFAVYSVQTANLVAATIGLNRATYTENTAFTNNAVLAATGIALTQTTSATTPHVQKVSLAQPLVYEANDSSDLAIEATFQVAGTTALRVYGIGAHVAVEYS